MKLDLKNSIVIIFYMALVSIVAFYLGGHMTESRQEKMAKETGTIFIKSQPYKISPIKEIVIEMKTN